MEDKSGDQLRECSVILVGYANKSDDGEQEEAQQKLVEASGFIRNL